MRVPVFNYNYLFTFYLELQIAVSKGKQFGIVLLYNLTVPSDKALERLHRQC